jgi:pimeloyl-ACP methyl ester carboxylesterase
MVIERPVGVAPLLTAVVAGFGVGLMCERDLIRRRLRPPNAETLFGTLRNNLQLVTASNGASVYVEMTVAPTQTEDPTVVFCPGYALNQDYWHYQRGDLAGRARLVFYDQQSPLRSSCVADGSHTIDHLGDGLSPVMAALARPRPLVRLGHPTGGRTIMALAQSHSDMVPEWFKGLVFLAINAGGLATVPLDLSRLAAEFPHRAFPDLAGVFTAWRTLVKAVRSLQNDLTVHLAYLYLNRGTVPELIFGVLAEMFAAPPNDVLADYRPEFDRHDKIAALRTFAGIVALVIFGKADPLSPPEHSRKLARRISSTGHLVVPETDHMFIIERPKLVAAELKAFIDESCIGRDGQADG